MTQSIFYIVPKDIEKPHITQEVQEPTVQEHKGEKREHLLAGGEIRCDLRFSISGRDKPVEINEFLETLPLG